MARVATAGTSSGRTAWLAQLFLGLFLACITTLHMLPSPMLRATTGLTVPYDARLNFMSELVRTQYGALMTLAFVLLACAGVAAALAAWRTGLRREAWLLCAAGIVCVLLAALPTDLVDLRTDRQTCGDPTRIEPCTWVGRAHEPLSSVVFAVLGLTWLSLIWRRRPDWSRVVRAGWLCGGLAVVLIVAARVSLIGVTDRLWVGLMQRALVAPAVVWLWVLTDRLRPSFAELVLARFVSITPPDGWIPVLCSGGRAFAPQTDVQKMGDDLENLPVSLRVQVVSPGASLAPSDLVVALMARRVRQGAPDWLAATVAGVPATACHWTDGVTDILSFFVILPGDHVVEVSLGRLWQPSNSVPLGELAEATFRGIRTRPLA